jgi:hypothetical protein
MYYIHNPANIPIKVFGNIDIHDICFISLINTHSTF